MALSITNTTANTLISGTDENDSVINIGAGATINLGGGDDTLFNGLDNDRADNVLINTGEGNNNVTIQAGSENVTIIGGNGNNRLESNSPKTLILAGNGDNSITFYTGADNGTIIGGAGNDNINAVGHNVTINGGAGNDTIRTFRNAFDITVNGGAGDDQIIVSGDVGGNINYNLIQYSAGDGNDTLVNLTSNDSVQIFDKIENAALSGNDVVMTISGGGTLTWLDTINKKINLLDAAGNLTETIFAGDRVDDAIVNDTVITGTTGNDSIFNEGARVTINALTGNDSITNIGNYDIINTGEGDNFVSVASGGSNNTINAGNGNNRVYTDENGTGNLINFGNGQNTFVGSDSYNTIIGGSGSECITLHNGSANSYVDTGEGDDTIAIGHNNITVDAGAGNDVILLYRDAENSIVKAGKGNDSITVYNNKHAQTYLYSSGDGNDIITGFDDDDTLKISGVSNFDSIISGDDVILGVGDGSITLAGSADKTLNIQVSNIINLTEGRHTVTTENVVYNGTDGVDLIRVEAANSTVYGYAGDDHLKSFVANVLLDGGDGDDRLVADTTYGITTLVGGKGDDRIGIISGKVLINYNEGDGNDIIGGVNSDTTINIAGGAIDSVSVNGSDYILKIGEGTITLQNATASTFYVNGSKVGAEWTKSGDNYIYTSTARNDFSQSASFTVSGADFQDKDNDNAPDEATVTAFSYSNVVGIMAALDHVGGEVTLNGSAVGVSGDSDYDVHFTAKTIDNAPANVIAYAEQIELLNISDGATITVKDNELIQIDSAATVHLIGSAPVRVYSTKGENKTLLQANNDNAIVLHNSDLNALERISGLADGYELTVQAGDNIKDELKFQTDGGQGTLKLGNSIYTLSGDKEFTFKFDSNGKVEGLENFSGMISGSGSLNINGNKVNLNSSLKAVDVDVLAALRDGMFTISGTNTIIDIDGNVHTVNAASNTSLTADGILVGYGNKANLIGGNGNDVLIAKAKNSTLTGGAGNDTFMGGVGLVQLTITDYMEGEDVIFYDQPFKTLSLNGKSSGNDYSFYINNQKITVKGGAKKTIKVVDVNGEVKYFGNYLTLDNNDSMQITAQANVVTIDAALRSDDIKITGNSNANTIIGGTGTNTMKGGSGADLFVHNGGNDYITDYKSGVDIIDIGNSTITGFDINSGDLILNTSEGNITIKGGRNKAITIKDSTGTTTKTYPTISAGLNYNATCTVIKADDTFKDDVIDLSNYLSVVKNVNASELTNSIKIIGNSNDNSLRGGNGNDTLIAGVGNNTLTGGSGNDVFVYESGNDIIKDYKVGEDKIKLNLEDVTSSTVKSSDVILTTNKGTLTIKWTKDKAITFVDDNGETTDRIFFEDTSYSPLDTGLTYDTKKVLLTASNKFSGQTIDLSEYLGTVTKINASTVSQNLSITGNSNDNSIKGGKGADTLFGGAGNDTLTGGSGNDVFVYESGNDVITDYTAGQDSIKINGTVSNISYNGKNVIFSVGAGSLTIKNAKGKNITISDSYNTYFKTFDLLYDNHFISDDNLNIDSVADISDTNYSVGQLQYFNDTNQIVTDSIVATDSYSTYSK